MVLAVIAFVILLALLALVAGNFDRTRRVRRVVVEQPMRQVGVREVVTERSVVTDRDRLL
jgi:uncharacterized protein involved in outer membrane biogenesis